MDITYDTKVFIAGCGGMLGEAVYKRFVDSCNVLATDIDLNEPWLEYADVRDLDGMLRLVRQFDPDLIINLAALTDLEYCERNPDDAWQTNALGAENMALISQMLDVRHVYISTAGIFDGQQEFYNDFDEPNPLSIYGKAKYYGERTVEKMLSKYFIFRAGWMMGGCEKDKKFINKIFKQIIAGKNKLAVVDDKLGTPTYTYDFADSIFRIMQFDYYGIYNMTCKGSCSRYDVAMEFLSAIGMDDKVTIEVVDSDYFSKEYFAPRPHSEKLVSMKLDARNIYYMRDWKQCLNEYSQHFKQVLKEQAVLEV
ncbi:MAG: NAD(P)-dependent oxidoreductase [Anaerohalosphaera sp.]|nr:NAD(P)-dependent oxidoreductase [Anaerohalosphaera sp.]